MNQAKIPICWVRGRPNPIPSIRIFHGEKAEPCRTTIVHNHVDVVGIIKGDTSDNKVRYQTIFISSHPNLVAIGVIFKQVNPDIVFSNSGELVADVCIAAGNIRIPIGVKCHRLAQIGCSNVGIIDRPQIAAGGIQFDSPQVRGIPCDANISSRIHRQSRARIRGGPKLIATIVILDRDRVSGDNDVPIRVKYV